MTPWRSAKPVEPVVTDDGVLVGGRVVPWEDVYHVAWTDNGGTVSTRAGDVKLDRSSAEAVERHIAPWEAERDAAVGALPDQERAAWLGPAGMLELPAARGYLVGCLGLGGVLLVMGLGAAVSTSYGVATAFWLIGLLVIRVALAQQGPPLVADDGGITAQGRRPRHYAWSDLRAIRVPHLLGASAGRPVAFVRTRKGPLNLLPGYERSGELIAAIQRCLACRREAVPEPESPGLFAGRQLFGGTGLWLDDKGLHRLPERRRGPVPWSELPLPVWGPMGPTLRLGRRRIPLWMYEGGLEMARHIDQRLGDDEPLLEADGELRGQAIERWLGVPPGGSLVCVLPPHAAGVRTGLLLAAVALVVWIMLAGVGGPRFGGGATGILCQGVIAAGAALCAMARSERTATADARGLTLRSRRGRHAGYAWSEILGIRPGGYGWTIETTRGKLSISNAVRNVERIVGAIQRMLAQRDFGGTLPSVAPLPETALSRMRGEDTEGQERGLSVAAHDDDGAA